MSDTIAGIATAPGEGGIAIIRISGDFAVDLFCAVFSAAGLTPPYKDHHFMYGRIIDLENKSFDEAMGVVMYAPRSYTKEDVCEIHTHGGYAAASVVMQLLIHRGARPAEAGEFTRRAFLNGRIDLAQAEAVMGIISARSAAALKSQETLLAGGTSRYIKDIQASLLQQIAGVEAYIDYPEEVDENEAVSSLQSNLKALLKKLQNIADERAARVMQYGLRVALYGSPNTGKSTLFNALLSEDRAIVTDIPGTTRDVLEGSFSLNGFQVQLLDTAGLRSSDEPVERIGIQRAKQVISSADVSLLLIDATKPLGKEETALLHRQMNCPYAILLNKEDKPPAVTASEILAITPNAQIFTISAKHSTGLEPVLDFLSSHLVKPREELLTHQRHISLALQAASKLKQALDAANSGVQLDLIAVDLREALWLLGRITGESVDDKLLDEIFSTFCVGK